MRHGQRLSEPGRHRKDPCYGTSALIRGPKPAPWLFASETLLRRTGTATELCGCLRGLLLGSSSPPGGPPGPRTPRRDGPEPSAG